MGLDDIGLPFLFWMPQCGSQLRGLREKYSSGGFFLFCQRDQQGG
jgi:hypothetical protein